MSSSSRSSLNPDPPIRKRKRSEVEDLTPLSYSNGKARSCNVLASPSCYEIRRPTSSKEDTSLTVIKKLEKARGHLTSTNYLAPENEIKLTDAYVKQKGDDHIRRLAISLLFRQCGSILEEAWDTVPIVAFIMNALGIARGSRASVKNIMRDVLVFGKDYDPNHKIKRRGKIGLISEYDGSANIIYKSLGAGISLAQTTIIVNKFRIRKNLQQISWRAVQGFTARSKVMKVSRRLTKKIGNNDLGSTWAKASLAQCEQYIRQINLGRLNGEPVPNIMYEPSTERPLYIDGIVFWDEKHKQCKLGHNSKYETQKAMKDGIPTSTEHGGKFPPKSDRPVPKYSGEARGLFGVGIRRIPDIEEVAYEGFTLKPFFYTDRKVVKSSSTVDGIIEKLNSITFYFRLLV